MAASMTKSGDNFNEVLQQVRFRRQQPWLDNRTWGVFATVPLLLRGDEVISRKNVTWLSKMGWVGIEFAAITPAGRRTWRQKKAGKATIPGSEAIPRPKTSSSKESVWYRDNIQQ